jgi:hypothetical protein
MTDKDNRQIERDSLFVMADLRIEGASEEQRVKVRNLSAGGMMAEGEIKVQPGLVVEVNIRNIGWIVGSVAWVQDDRFGIAFHDEIDPKVARATFSSAANNRDVVLPPTRSSYSRPGLRKR